MNPGHDSVENNTGNSCDQTNLCNDNIETNSGNDSIDSLYQSKSGKIRNQYNLVPHLTQDTTWERAKTH